MNIVFIGASGCGKSTFGAYCAKLMNMPFIDTDAEIASKFGSISSIFSVYGEDFFRMAETNEIALASEKDECVVSVGGGAVKNPENMKTLAKNGLIVYLLCSENALFERLEKDGGRPLVGGAELTRDERRQNFSFLFAERKPLYEKYGDIVIDEDEIYARIRAVDDATSKTSEIQTTTVGEIAAANTLKTQETACRLMFTSLIAKLGKKIYPDR